MNRYTLLLVLLIAVAGCRRGAPEPTTDDRLEAAALMAGINDERSQAGKEPVQLSDALSWEAQEHAEWMQSRGRLKHADIRYGAENIAWGQRTGKEVLRDWMNSPGHRRNILGLYTHVGIGKSGGYWCLRLSRGEESSPEVRAAIEMRVDALQQTNATTLLWTEGAMSENSAVTHDALIQMDAEESKFGNIMWEASETLARQRLNKPMGYVLIEKCDVNAAIERLNIALGLAINALKTGGGE